MSDQQGGSDPFAPATKKKAKGRFGLYGVSSSGKTETALLVAMGLCPGGTIALLDTEAGSASKYADRYDFLTATMKAPFAPERLARLVAAAARDKDVLILDGISPFWDGPGGVMAIVDASKQRGPGGGWKDGTPAQNLLVQTIINAPCHVIITMRAKSDTVIEQQDGKQTMRKLGLKPIQRDGIDYELDLLAFMDLDHSITIEKSRAAFPGKPWHLPVSLRIEPGDISLASAHQPAYELGVKLRAWLEDGVAAPEPVAVDPPTPAPISVPTAPATSAPTSAPSATPPPAPTAPTGPSAPTPPPPPPPATPETPAAAISVPPAPVPSAAPAAPQAPAQPAQAAPPPIAEQTAKAGELRAALEAIRPDVEWDTLLATKTAEWFGGKTTFAQLEAGEASMWLERVEGTLLNLRERAAQAAS